ncbi:MAG TPA: hypothetical protein VGH74_21860 [Planctomycetaceae bacterium]|jgi:hypothetical protein
MGSVTTARRQRPVKEALELFNGDRLSQAEFHRRYEAQPDDVRFELIGGVDLNQKKSGYQRAGVKEYLVVCLEEQELHWFSFRPRRRIVPDRQGVFRSHTLPGLWLDGPALLARSSSRLLRTLEQGLASEEHAAFARRLADRRKG